MLAFAGYQCVDCVEPTRVTGSIDSNRGRKNKQRSTLYVLYYFSGIHLEHLHTLNKFTNHHDHGQNTPTCFSSYHAALQQLSSNGRNFFVSRRSRDRMNKLTIMLFKICTIDHDQTKLLLENKIISNLNILKLYQTIRNRLSGFVW